MELKEKQIPDKKELVKEALKYDKRGDSGYLVTPSTAFSKGVRLGITICLPFIQDYFKNKLEKIIK